MADLKMEEPEMVQPVGIHYSQAKGLNTHSVNYNGMRYEIHGNIWDSNPGKVAVTQDVALGEPESLEELVDKLDQNLRVAVLLKTLGYEFHSMIDEGAVLWEADRDKVL